MSDLFVDYLDGKPEIAGRFATGFRSEDDWREAAERASSRSLDREALVEALLDQSRHWEMPDAVLHNVERLRDERSVAVVTGQQLGAFGGPLFTLYKTITAIRLAEEMEARLGMPVVPVFWVEGEDHDFAEIATIHLLSRNDLVDVSIEKPSAGPSGGAVGRMVFGDEITTAIDRVDDVLAPSDFHDEVIAILRDSYAPGRTLEDAFVHLWKRLFAERGLVFLNPDDARLKRLMLPLFERDLTDGQQVVDAVMNAGAALRERYHQQVTARPTNLFYLETDARHAIDEDGDGFSLRGAERRWQRDELIAELRDHPERFSPNVVTRPLMQDALLPTAYYVAGPGEIAYFAQYREVYDWAGIPMPGIYPRMSATLVEPKVKRVLDRYELDLADLSDGPETAFARLVREMEGNGVSSALEAFKKELHGGLGRLKPEIEAVDHSLGRSVEATRAGMVRELERLEDRVFRAQKRQHDELRAQVEKAAVNVLPDGRLQERVLSPLYVLNKFGLTLIDRLFDELDLDTTRHQVIDL